MKHSIKRLIVGFTILCLSLSVIHLFKNEKNQDMRIDALQKQLKYIQEHEESLDSEVMWGGITI